MTEDSGTVDLVDHASAGVENLADTATSALDRAGPIGALAEPVVGVLRNVWEGYFGVPVPPGATNWNAYTHQQLYQMLWQNADVGEVSSVAAEWGRRSTELADNAQTLRGQRAALRQNWSGQAAEPAANRLGELETRTSGIGARAGAVQQATQNAGDALAVARNNMPPPPGDQAGAMLAGAAAGAGAGAAIGAIAGAAAGGVGAGPGALIGAAIGAVAGGAASMFLASLAEAEEKAQAVRVMQQYEADLADASHAIAPTPAGATLAATMAGGGATTTSGFTGSVAGVGGSRFGSGGVPWQRLTSADPLASGATSGVDLTGLDGQLLGQGGALSAEMAAHDGMLPPGGGARARGDRDSEHANRLPTIDQKLFDIDDQAAPRVIG
jgi:hypothetical protein